MPTDDAPRRFSPPLATPEIQGAMPAFLRRLGWLIAAVTLLLAFGTVGFVVTEDVSVWRGFVWSLDTVATVGSIPSPASEAGQAVKVVLITLGVGTLFYALVTVTEFFVAGHLGGMLAERRALKMTNHLSGHHLICGFGRVGRQVARDLAALGQPFVVIDRDSGHREEAEQIGAPLIVGMPSDDETLRRAGIERAASVLACVDSDAENIFVTLTARELRPDVTIVARASVSDSEKKLRRAGADRVISPYKASGSQMARMAVHPQVPVAFDVAPEYRLEQIEVPPGCAAESCPLGEVRGAAMVVAVHRDGGVELDPSPETTVRRGDVIVAVGDDEAMDALEAAFAPPRPAPAG